MSTDLGNLPCSLPKTPIPPDTNPAKVAISFETQLKNLSVEDFFEDALWRDTFALTGTIRTFYSASTTFISWRRTCETLQVTSFAVDAESSRITRIGDESAWVDVPFTFKTSAPPATLCSGSVSLVPDSNGKWKIWVLRTILEQLKGQENADVLEVRSKTTQSSANGSVESKHFECAVVGGGPSGLSMSGRLQALGISYIMLDKNKEVGDCWKGRYSSAKLHTPKEYSHLPFGRTFPAHYQELLTKDELAEGYQDWASRYGINVSLGSTLTSGVWEPDQQLWKLSVMRMGRQETITSSYLVFAVGGGGRVPVMPTYPNKDMFNGIVLHSAEYKDALQWKGKRGLIIGAANSGHDIAEDMVAAGLASVTMVQRSSTYVLPYEYFKESCDRLFNTSIPVEIADRIQNSSPLALSRLLSQADLHAKARNEPERFDALEAKGFKTERYGDVIQTLAQRGGGHYMDVGNCENIVRGLVQIKSDSLSVSYIPTGLAFADGTTLPADVIVFATGFVGNLRNMAQEIFGKEVADLAGDYWGLDDEGEIRGAFKPTGHPAFWYHGGTLGTARYYSRFIAMQIQAKLLGTPLRVYNK